MISRLFLAAVLAASLAACPACAQGQPTPASAAAPIVIPAHKCAKPEYPGKLASSQKFNAFNKEFNAYGECMKKYIEETKLILNAAATAVNGAVEEFNKFAADIKAQDEAAKN
jgi:hypothetical protein